MRKLHSTTRFKLTDECSTRGSASPTGVRHPRDPLRLPRKIHAPRALKLTPDQVPRFAFMAIAMLKAGFLNDNDEGDVPALLTKGFARIGEQILGKLDYVDLPSIVVAPDRESLQYSYDPSYEAEDESARDIIWIGLRSNQSAQFVAVGAKAQVLEAKAPGLGQALMRVIDDAVNVVGGATPASMRMLAEMLYWYGVSSQKDWQEEIEDQYGEDADIPWDEMLSPDDYDQAFSQPWAIEPKKPISKRRIAALAKQADDQFVRAVCLALSELQALQKGFAPFPSTWDIDLQPAYMASLVRWDESDPITQVLDDHIEQANLACDCHTDMYAVWKVDATEAECAKWLNDFVRGLRIHKALDDLLKLVGEPSPEN